MGGKRPDQHNIDPAEGRVTDHKSSPQTGLGHSSLDDTVEIDRQRVAQSEHEAHQFPGRGRSVPPSRDANRALHKEDENEGNNRDEGAGAGTARGESGS